MLDGLGSVEEYCSRAPTINQKFLTISDHGMMGAVPRQIRGCDTINDKHGKDTLSPIFAIEFYHSRLQPECNHSDDMQRFMKDLDAEELKEIKQYGAHLLAIACNETGYKNLVKLSSWGWTKGFYHRPRINDEQLIKYKEGIIFTSCCYASEVGKAFEKGMQTSPQHAEELGNAAIERLLAIFGKEHYYLEIMLLDFQKQKPYNSFIVKASQKYGLKIIISCDVHYPTKEDSKFQRMMLMVQTKRTMQGLQKAMKEDSMQDFFELQDTNLWMKSEEELNDKWFNDYQDVIPYEIFCQAKLNTIEICNRAKGVQLDRSLKLPVWEDADERLKDEIMKGFAFRQLPKNKVYLDRIKEEYNLITRKGFSTYFLLKKMMIDEARRISPVILGWGDGSEAVGCGRGCLEGSVLIPTLDGTVKPIRDIVTGDFVYTIDGTPKKVLKTVSYPIKEELLCIKTFYGDNKGVTLTKDHKIYAEKHQRVSGFETWAESTKKSHKSFVPPTGNLKWMQANEIEIGDWVFVPTLQLPASQMASFDLAVYCNSDNLSSSDLFVFQDRMNPLTKKIRDRRICQRTIPVDDKLLYVLGRFAGDGWFRSDNSGRIGFAFHSDDSFGIAVVKKFFTDLKVNVFVRKSIKKKLKQLYVNNRFVQLLFKDLFNNYKCTPFTKHIPNFVMGLSESLKWAFLRGYFESDGHQAKSKISFDTVSVNLAAQVRALFLSMKTPISLNYMDRLDKRTGKKSFCYKLNTPLNENLGFGESKLNPNYKKIDNGILLRVRSIETIKNVDQVYDFEVEDNHNYLTSSFLVHNSAVGALTCYCLRITDVDPVYEGLLFSRFMSDQRGGREIILDFKNIDPLPPEEMFS